MNLAKHLLLFSLFFITLTATAQTKITGKITDATSGSPLSNVSVKISGTSTGAITNTEGSFSLAVQPGAVLEITYIGYSMQTITIGSETNLSIRLEPAFTELNPVVMVGTRGVGRIKTETPVPVDVVNVSRNALPTARMGITDVLNYAAPSFNYNKQSVVMAQIILTLPLYAASAPTRPWF